MPLYEYVCHGCERRFEALARSFNDTAACPHCGSADVGRLLSTFAMSGGRAEGPAPAMAGGGGGCCGGGCGCRH